MANNCLITKLKGVVNNNDIPTFNAITIDKPLNTSTQIVALPTSLIEVIEGDGHLYDLNNNDLGTSAITSYANLLKNTSAKVRVNNKYNITSISLKNVECSDDIADYINYLSPNVESINLIFPDIYTTTGIIGDLDNIPAYQELVNLTIINGGPYHINVESIAKFPKLVDMTLFMNNTLDGDLVELVKNYVRAGRTKATIVGYTYNYGYEPARGLKFNGESLVGDYIDTNLIWSTENGTTTVRLTSTNRDELTATFTL